MSRLSKGLRRGAPSACHEDQMARRPCAAEDPEAHVLERSSWTLSGEVWVPGIIRVL